MIALRRGFDLWIFSEDFRAAVRRRLNECAGLFLIGLAVLAAIALATWSVQDPSLSHATKAPVRNLLGLPGAVAADLLMQLFGLAALAWVLPVAIWGWRLVTHRPLDRERLRVAFWIAGALLAAAFAACLPTLARWPLPTGLGGVAGDLVLRLPAAFAGGALAGTGRTVTAGILGLAAALALAFAVGAVWPLRGSETGSVEPDEGGAGERESPASVSLGLLFHGFLSAKARLGRWLGAASTFGRRASTHCQKITPVTSQSPMERCRSLNFTLKW